MLDRETKFYLFVFVGVTVIIAMPAISFFANEVMTGKIG